MTARTMVAVIVVVAALAPASGSASQPSGTVTEGVMTNFAVLVGFASDEDATSIGVLLVPGTVIPLAIGDSGAADAGRRTLERNLAFTRAVDRLWSTFRLDPTRRVQKARYLPASVGEWLELPALNEARVTISATLLGFNEAAATYRVVFRQGDKQLADSTVSINRGGRAVVGGMDGEAAPYIFVFVEPDPPGGVGGAVRFSEGSDLTAPVVVDKANPVYPEEARKSGITGIVVLDLEVDTAGRVIDTSVLESPNPLLAESAVAAVRQWRFEPARRADGSPVEVRYVITVKYALE